MQYQASVPTRRHARRVLIQRAGQSAAWVVSASKFYISVRAREGRAGEDGNLAQCEAVLPAAVDGAPASLRAVRAHPARCRDRSPRVSKGRFYAGLPFLTVGLLTQLFPKPTDRLARKINPNTLDLRVEF